METEYIVIYPFKDLEDNDHVYVVGDVYGGKKTKTRIEALTTGKNNIKRPLIKETELVKPQVDENQEDSEIKESSTKTTAAKTKK